MAGGGVTLPGRGTGNVSPSVTLHPCRRVNLALAYTELTEELCRLRNLSSLQSQILRALLQEKSLNGGKRGGAGAETHGWMGLGCKKWGDHAGCPHPPAGAELLHVSIPGIIHPGGHPSQGVSIPGSIHPREHPSRGASVPGSIHPGEHPSQGASLPRSIPPAGVPHSRIPASIWDARG